MIRILVGEMGVGKNFVGEILAKRLDCKFVDGDDFLTPTMKAKVENFSPLTEEDLDEYMIRLLNGIVESYQGADDIVVAQALYREKHRFWLKSELEKRGYLGTTFIWIKTPSIFTHLNRLRSRNLKWVLYGLLNKPFFQKCKGYHAVIKNSTDKEVSNQIERLINQGAI